VTGGRFATGARRGRHHPDEQTAPCWVEISHDGRYLFAVNNAAAT
jgi:hypothetical protein